MKKTKVALALGSGGARGLAQIGVIEELEKNNFEIVAIAGTSIGSLIGGLYANNHLDEFRDWMKNLDKSKVFDLVDFTLNAQGFVKGDKVFNVMKKLIPSINIEDLEIPFTAVSADINSKKEVRISSGDLYEAIRASVAIPSVLTPAIREDQVLVDGGVVNPLPISAIPKSDAELTIAINLNAAHEYVPVVNEHTTKHMEKQMWGDYINNMYSLSFKKYFFSRNSKKSEKPNYFEIVNSSFDMMQDKLTEVTLENLKPDLLVSIPRDSASTFDFHKTAELIEYGKQAMQEALKSSNS